MTPNAQRPHVFLFDPGAEGVEDPALAFFTRAFLKALGQADPGGATRARLRAGLPMLAEAASRITAVRTGGGLTRSYDMSVYKLLVWDWLDTTTDLWSTLDTERTTELFRIHTCECLALTDLSPALRCELDQRLRTVQGYVGGFELDLGNPIYREAFLDRLLDLAAIMDGAVIQEMEFGGARDWPVAGAETFQPNGLVWQPFGQGDPETPRNPGRRDISARGAVTRARFEGKRADRVEHRVLEGLLRDTWRASSTTSYEFELADVTGSGDILEAILPDGKFTHYLFDPSHAEGGPKGAFFTKELAIAPEDWRFLAAQFYEGLVRSIPADLEIRSWKEGYGARFNVYLRITGRNGAKVVVRTGWMLKPGHPPSLSTVFPDRVDGEIVEPGLPPIADPALKDEDLWAAVFELAHSAGEKAYAEAVPTPLFVEGHGVWSEGAFGSADVVLVGAAPALRKWLRRSGRSYAGPRGQLVVGDAPGPAFDRARAYAMAFARVLILNGFKATIDERPD